MSEVDEVEGRFKRMRSTSDRTDWITWKKDGRCDSARKTRNASWRI